MAIQQQSKDISRVIQGVLYIGASVFHFINDAELAIIPPFLPWRRAALYITGVFEFLGGLGLLIPRFQRPASWGLAALLVAIWPANMYHAALDRRSRRWRKTRLYHILRFPLQIALIVWVLWATEKKDVSGQ
ncbi:MAG TPA: hypothetical protein VGD98_12560 [Ktedonobacteraceae bacterium]